MKIGNIEFHKNYIVFNDEHDKLVAINLNEIKYINFYIDNVDFILAEKTLTAHLGYDKSPEEYRKMYQDIIEELNKN